MVIILGPGQVLFFFQIQCPHILCNAISHFESRFLIPRQSVRELFSNHDQLKKVMITTSLPLYNLLGYTLLFPLTSIGNEKSWCICSQMGVNELLEGILIGCYLHVHKKYLKFSGSSHLVLNVTIDKIYISLLSYQAYSSFQFIQKKGESLQ